MSRSFVGNQRSSGAGTKAAVLLLVLSGCMKARDLRSVLDRPVSHTAYAAPGAQAEVAIGEGQTERLGVVLGGSVGIGEVASVRMNLAHAIGGALTIGGRVTLVDTDRFALGVDSDLVVVRGRWLWFLPRTVRDDLAGLTMITAPISLTATVPLHDRVLVSLSGGYDHTSVFGSVATDSVVYDGAIGSRRLTVRSTLHLQVGKHVVLETTAQVPLLIYGLTNAVGSVEVSPGIRVGIRTHEWARLPALRTYAWRITGEVRAGSTRFRVGVLAGPVHRAIGLPVSPHVGLRWAP